MSMMKSVLRRVRWLSLSPFKVRKRHKLQIVVILLSLNVLISLSILNQQSKLTTIFDRYFTSFQYRCDNNELLELLNTYRTIFTDRSNFGSPSSHGHARQSLSLKNDLVELDDVIPSENKIHDLYFNDDLTGSNHGASWWPRSKSKTTRVEKNEKNKSDAKPVQEFFSPRVLLENRDACSRNRSLFMMVLIHSHANNYLRRKTMRDTWLSIGHLRLSDLYPDAVPKYDPLDQHLTFSHLFVIGNDRHRRPQLMEAIRNESHIFNDILMIDVEETYKNLVYKHLALVNWVSEHCLDVSYVLKLDDDVLVNIKALTRQLFEKRFEQATSRLEKVPKKFLYCNINQHSLPVRHNASKWFVAPSTYPFEWYPKYCEGFAYITNLETIRFMREQSQRIPRFWIDDVYFTGLLFHGMDDIRWIDFKGHLSWAYYDFWDLGNTLSIYELYAYVLKLFNINVTDYYKTNHFIILHSQPENEEVNYTISTVNVNGLSSNALGPGVIRTPSVSVDDRRSQSEFCKSSILKYFSSLPSTEKGNSSGVGENTLEGENYLDCLEFINDRKFILDVYFFEFCRDIWLKNFV